MIWSARTYHRSSFSVDQEHETNENDTDCLYAHAEVVVTIFGFFEFEISIFEAFLRCDPEYLGLESSGRTVGFIFTDSHTNQSSWCRVMTKNPNKLTTKLVRAPIPQATSTVIMKLAHKRTRDIHIIYSSYRIITS